MQTYNRVEHPVLDVFIDGTAVETRPSSFTLITDAGFPSVVAHLQFPVDAEIGEPGALVTVSLSIDGECHKLFTGEVYLSGARGSCRSLSLTDGYKKLCDTSIAAAYRKEMARIILQDTLECAGLNDTDITCPAVEIARFSTEKISADKIITHLIKTLEEHGHHGLRFFFDEKNIFRFGTPEDSGKNEGPDFSFETGKNILQTKDNLIEILPQPIRHSQKITVNGKKLMSARTELYLSGKHSRMTLWLKEAL